jgi:protein-L-isoaspartate(D-aspartate) O-methyltransferase
VDPAGARQAFAEELRYVAHIRCDHVVAAFAAVPREAFLGPPPWQIYDHEQGGYWTIPTSDPTALYHNVLIAIDAARELNNGHPEFWARLLDKLHIRQGERVFHLGAGVGYYTAIIAELVGLNGTVIAAEIDPALARRAQGNLASWPAAHVTAADGAQFDPGPIDAIVVNAGATHPLPIWLTSLRPGGRLLLPLTADNGRGTVFLIERATAADTFRATAISRVGIYPCAGAREPKAARRLRRALEEGGQRFVRTLRLDAHEECPTCWLHEERHCLSLIAAPE